jgi:hypothetical protein
MPELERMFMFKRCWRWFGKLVSDEGFSIARANRSINYTDDHGTFQFAYEDGFLIPKPHQVAGEEISLTQQNIDQMVDRVMRGINSEGGSVQVWREQ